MIKRTFRLIVSAALFLFAALPLTACRERRYVGGNKTPVYTIEYAASAGGYISGEKLQTVRYGMSGAPVSAIPYEGFRFVSWSDNNTRAGRMEEDVRKNLKFTAYFDRFGVKPKSSETEPEKIKPQTSTDTRIKFRDLTALQSCTSLAVEK